MQEPRDAFDFAAPTSSFMRKTSSRGVSRSNLFEECRNILRKGHQSRIPADNQTLIRLLQKSEFLKEVVEIQGMDFLKGILRHAKIQIVDERQVIAEQDQPLNYMIVVLEGKLGVERSNFIISADLQANQNKEYLDNLSLKNEGLISKLTELAKKERDQLRKTSKLQKKTSLPVSQYQFTLPLLTHTDFSQAISNIQRNLLINEEYGGKHRLNGTSNPNRVLAIERSVLLVLQFNFLFYWLQVAFKAKLTKNIQRLRTIPAFEFIEQQKLAEIIVAMELRKRKKNDVIYKQGEQAEHIYLLIQGELKITKEIDLFKQNPNDFYVDRRQLVKNTSQQVKRNKIRSFNKDSKKDKDNILHFANLTTLYNYRPMKKSLEIGLISSGGFFGEEEVVYGTKRQATVHVNSIDVSYYMIEFKKVLQIVGKMQDKFKQILETSLSKRILYRQHGFASQIDFQNRNNLNYFFLQQGKSEYDSPRKYKLQKINEKVVPNTARDTTDHAPPYYTTFNFNKMTKKKLSQPSRKESEQKTNESIQPFSQPRYNQTEEKLMGISHSWNPIERKVKQQKLVSRKISPFKHQINISQPLIDQQFFKDVAKQQRRINKEFRTIRLSLGKKIK